MKKRHEELERQIREATGANGKIDQGRLLDLIDAAYRARDEERAKLRRRKPFVESPAPGDPDSFVQNEHLFRDFAAAVSDRFWECDREFRMTRRWTSQNTEITLTDSDFIGKYMWEIYRGRDGSDNAPALRSLLEARQPFREFDGEIRASDGRKRYRRLNATPYYDDDGAFLGYRGSAKDVTEESELRTLSAELYGRLESIINNSPSAIALKDLDGRFQLVNRRFSEWHGISRKAVTGLTIGDILPAPVAERRQAEDRNVIETLSIFEQEQEFRTASGERFPVHTTKYPVFDADGELTGVGTTFTDISELRNVEAALGDSEVMFRTAFAQNAVGMAIRAIDPRRSRWLEVNQKLCDMLGYTREELLKLTSVDISVPDEQETAIAYNEKLMHGELTSYSREKRYVRKDGQVIWTNVWLSAVPDRDGRPAKVISVIEDITDRKNSEAALRESEARLRVFMDSSPSAILIKDKEGRYIMANKCWHGWFNPEGADIAGRTVFDFFPRHHAEAVTNADNELLKTGRRSEKELLTPRADGTIRTTLLQKFPIFAEDGAIIGIAGINTDISEHKAMEEQLAHAQKMEAVGNLTGGVAHDFNNLLTVILGNAQLLALEAKGLEHLTGPVVRASRRGAELTQRLLAFSRRQPLQPKPTSLSALVEGMSDLLRRTLGETVEITVSSAPDLWPALVDPGQVENALLNLAINSRDAMPDGGRLIISCANRAIGAGDVAADPDARPGDYAVISVSDTGTGMPPEVMERAFEPFFTTKEVGQGSGLGLSMVYGFTRQSGGFIALDSAENQGTTVTLHLPRASETAPERTSEAAGAPQRGRNETILLIEDEDEVRELGIRMLERLGYRVIPASDGPAARKALDDGPLPDLILSDVVLPGGISGPEFVTEARRRHPGLKVIFMSGYPAEALAGDGTLGRKETLINKPFRIDDLAAHLRAAFDGTA